MAIYTTPQTNDGFAEYTAADVFTEVAAASGVEAALLNSGTANITGSTFSANSITALKNTGTATLVDATISGNTCANASGGMISTKALFVTNSVIDSNAASIGGGGAGLKFSGSATIVGSTFSNNRGSAAISIGSSGVAEITGSLFAGNTSTYSGSNNIHGGAIRDEAGSGARATSLINSTFTRNRGQFGSSLYANGKVNIYSCTFTANTGAHAGGVAYIQNQGRIASTQTIYEGNRDNGAGGGAIYGGAGVFISDRDLFLHNFAPSAGAIYVGVAATVTGSTFTANTCSGNGGVIVNHTYATISGSTFTDNFLSNTNCKGGVFFNEVTGSDTTGYTASTTNISQSVFIANTAGGTSAYGGVMFNQGSSVSITGSTFSDNITDGDGGVISNHNQDKTVNGTTVTYSSDVNITGSTFTGNTAKNGGAIRNSSTMTISNSVLENNYASSRGGALFAYSSLTTVTNTLFKGNTANENGAAINNDSLAYVNDSTFTGNTALSGGAIRNSGTMTVSGGTFENNYASSDGGALFANGGVTTVTNSLFKGNTASSGSAIKSQSGVVYIDGSTFTDNFGSSGAINGTVSVNNSLFDANRINSGNGYGSAMSSISGTISNSTFTNNYGRFGGVVYLTTKYATFIGNTFSTNRTYNVGGVAYFQQNSFLASTNNTYCYNRGSGDGAGVFYMGGGTISSLNDYYHNNLSYSDGGVVRGRSSLNRTEIDSGTFTANTATNFGGALSIANPNVFISNSLFTNNRAKNGGAIANDVYNMNSTASLTGTVSITNSTFTANTATEDGGALYNRGAVMTVTGCVFDGNDCGATSHYGGAIFNTQITYTINEASTVFHGLATIQDSQFLTASDYVQTASGATSTLKGTITTAATFKGGGSYVADGLNLVFNGDTAISINALTETGDGLTGVTFANTGKVTLTNQNLSAKTITINQATAGAYTLADGISALNTNLTVNGTAMTLVSGTASAASADGQVAQVVSFASNTLNLTVYDKLFVGGNFTEDATHFASLANLQATYAGYSGLVIDCDDIFYNNTWTSETVPSTTTLGDGTVVNLAWGGNAFADLAAAKTVLAADGILTFEGVVPTTAQTEDVNTVRIHSASISAESTTIKSNRLILDSVAIPGTKRFYTDGSGDDDFVTLVNINEPTSYFYTGYIRKEGDFNLDVSNSNISRFYVSNGTNSGVGGTVNFTITDSTTNRISLSASSDTGTSFNDINIVVNNTFVHTTKPNGQTDLEQGDIRATGSSDNVHIYGDSRVTMNGSTANILFGSKGNIVHGSIYLTMDASTVANVIGKGTVDSVQGSSYLTIAGTTASVISAAITTVDVITVADGATLNLGDVTVTNSNFTVNTDYDGTVAVLANSTVTLAGNVSLAKNFTLGTNAAIVAADDAVITLAASGTFSTAIGTGTGNTLVLDNATVLTVATTVTGFAAITFKGDTAVDLNSQSLAGKAITIDTNNVWTNGVTTIATGISSLDGATFSVNGQVAELDTPMFNGSILSFANGNLTLTVTAVEVTDTNTLDDALAATAVNPGVITFAEATDGTTCTFSGATFAHDQVFQGNGATNTAIQSADASMVFANGHEISMGALSWNGIIYGGARNSDTTETSLSFQDAAIGGNVFGGGRAESGSDVSMGTVSLSIADSAQATGKAVYGGGYANGGTATLTAIDLSLDDVTGGNSVYGAGAVNAGGKLGAGSVATAISGGVYGAVYNGANIYTSGTGSEFTAGEMSLAIDGGTFTGAVGNGSTPRGGASSRQGASTLAISDGLFQGIVYGGAASFGGTTTNATVASTTVTISGGTFNGKVFGGNVGQTGAKAANTVLTGTSNLTIDGSTANIYFNENVFGGSMGEGIVGGNVTVTFKGNGNHLHFDNDSFLSGDSEYAYGVVSYVQGAKTLVFDGFTNSFSANIQGPAFETVTIKNGSQVNVRGGATNQDFSFVSTWNFELSSAEAVMITDDPVSSGKAKNSFYGATINLTFADGAETVVAGTDWTVYKGKEATLNYWNELGSLTIGGEAATSGTLAGNDFLAWSTDEYQVYVDGNYDIRLAKLA